MKAWGGMETYEEIWGIEGVAMKRHTVRGECRHSAARETTGKEKKQYCTVQEKCGLLGIKEVRYCQVLDRNWNNEQCKSRTSSVSRRAASYMSELRSALGAR